MTTSFRAALIASLALAAAAACASPAPTASPVPTAGAGLFPTAMVVSPQASPVAGTAPGELPQAPLEPAGQTAQAFTVAVITDSLSEAVTREQAQAVMAEASGLLQPLTSISLLMTDFVEDAGGGLTSDMASRYISSHSTLPNGLVILSFGDEGRAKINGSYSYAIGAPTGYKNAFVSPIAGEAQLYVAVVHFGHKYEPCGYGGSEVVQGSTSLGGECGGLTGSACTQHNGYSMCANAVPHLYASTPTRFLSSTILHELMHPFSTGGDQDHYNTPGCNTRMGYPAQFYDLQEAQYHSGLCPYVFEEFVKAYQP